jgi:hypothetical protein
MATDLNSTPKKNVDLNSISKKLSQGEVGQLGYERAGGYVTDEFLPELRGVRGLRKYREMGDNDPTCGALLSAIEKMIQAVKWDVIPADESPEAQDYAVFAKQVLFEDMETEWDDFITEALSMLRYGWSYFEIVTRRRLKKDGSKFDDGWYGIERLAPRAQETLLHWEIDDKGKVLGLWQLPPNGGFSVFIPIDKALHFVTKSNKGSPEGYSVLRNAYKPYSYLDKIQKIEAIGIERDLTGLPVVKIPSDYFNEDDSGKSVALSKFTKLARDLRFNEQGGIVIPSDPFQNDQDGSYTNTPLVSVELMASAGQKAIDADKVITRYQQDIARSVLADFLMLGTNDRGSFSLSKSKADLFLHAINGFSEKIGSTLRKQLLERLFKLNGFDTAKVPYVKPGKVAPIDIQELGDYIRSISSVGVMFSEEEQEQLNTAAGIKSERLQGNTNVTE